MIYQQAAIALILCGVASAHVCMWSPVQRGGADIDTPGERFVIYTINNTV